MKKLFTLFLLGTCFTATAQEDKVTYELVNLGKKVNTKYHESAPIISADGKTLYFFVANHHENNQGKSGSQDIWYSELDSSGEWQEAKHMPSPLNKNRFNQVMTVLNEGSTLLIRGDGKSGEGFALTHRTKNGWSNPKDMKIDSYESMRKGIYSGGSMSPDGKVLMLYFNESPKARYSDLYVSFAKDDGSFSRPKRLGPAINTHQDEFGPFLAADGVTMYFASNRPGGLGNVDIYKTTRLDNSWLKWSKPENLGAPVNTTGFDAYYTVDASGKNAFTTRAYMSPDGGSLDVLGLRPKKAVKQMVTLSGHVYNKKTFDPVEANIVYDAEGKETGVLLSDIKDGKYKVTVPVEALYLLNATAEGFLSKNDTVNLAEIGSATEIKKDIYLTPIEVGTTVRLNNIFFDFDKIILRPESFPELDKVVEMLNQNGRIEIEIAGHTDDKGSDEYNRVLSQGRAEAVRSYIVDQGIDDFRITAKGYGEAKPEVSNDSDEGRQQNRRVEFTVLKN
jgi:OOP family OmpA-OmpF porin